MSYERSQTVGAYFWKRFLRVYPAYATVVLGGAVLLFAASNRSFSDYFGAAWLRYVIANLSFLNFIEPMLPGVFEGNSLGVVNASLWTLKVECLFYAVIPLFYKFTRRHSVVLAVSYLGASLVCWSLKDYHQKNDAWVAMQLWRQIFDPLCYFVSGALVYKSIDWLLARWWTAFALSLAALGAVWISSTYFLLPLFLASSVLLLATCPHFEGLHLPVDLSYGLYVVHFPVEQVLVHLGLSKQHPGVFLLCSWGSSLAIAWLLWEFVESRFLKRPSWKRPSHTSASPGAASGPSSPPH